MPNPEMTCFNADGTYEHVSLMSGENEIIYVAEDTLGLCHTETKRPVMAFNACSLGTKEAVDHAYAVLSAEARINESPNGPTVAGWDNTGTVYGFSVVDKFGVYWWIAI